MCVDDIAFLVISFVIARSESEISGSFRLVSFRYPSAWSLCPKMARFEIQEGTARMREKHGDLRNYGRWKTGDLPGDRHRHAPGIRYRVTRVAGA